VEGQTSRGGYNAAGEFVRDVLRREQARAHVDAQLLDALESGPVTPMTRQDWQRIRITGRRRVSDARSKRR